MQIGVYEFPEINTSHEDGFVAAGGDLQPSTMIDAYQHGLFPWHDSPYGPCWYSPDPRMVLYPNELHIQKSMRPYLNGSRFTFKMNTAFAEVLEACANIPRHNQAGTWIWDDYRTAMMKLHEIGLAISGETWENDTLVGGLYGLYINGVLYGESMFSNTSNASKFAFIKTVQSMPDIRLVDSQVPTEHLKRLGAVELSRDEFLAILRNKTV
ncbi:MAG: leucyl/phenylalanyl-tRNA--protein transferase [Cryomorphaceae bacterium]|nr:leucyl/phenylalanyl-tRNA--protein transferase [Cryomorphaceae bacterium]